MRLFDDVASAVDDPFLRRACELAERARGATSPNPLVGCVIVSEGVVVGEGYHPRAGEPHAEVFALAAAGARARGADAYVTLEPCRHHGRTPPCTEALVSAGVAREIIGMPDPTSQAGGGAVELQRAGIEVRFAEDPAPFELLNEGWLALQRRGRPLVVAKLGLSLDAAVALAPGERASMTGESGASVTRILRSRADAVMVGAATVVADDPALTVRDAQGTLAHHQPTRVVLARSGLPPADARLFTDGAAPTLVLLAPGAAAAGFESPDNVAVEHLTSGARLAVAFDALGNRGLAEVLVEPGPRLLEALRAEDLIDYLVTVVAGGVAGPGALPAFGGADAPDDRALSHRFSAVEAGIVGDVSVTVWRHSQEALEPTLRERN